MVLKGAQRWLQWTFRREVANLHRRAFVSRLSARLDRMDGEASEFALVLVDIANLAAIQRQWGAATAQACSAHVANTLNTLAGGRGLTGHLRDNRFALASWDADTIEHRDDIGRSMIACGLTDYAANPSLPEIEIRVVTGVLNTNGASAKRMLAHMEYVLFRNDDLSLVSVYRPFMAQYEASGF